MFFQYGVSRSCQRRTLSPVFPRLARKTMRFYHHAEPAIKAAHYVENRKRGVTGLGAVLATKRRGKKIVEFSGVRQSHIINRAKAEPVFGRECP